MNAAQWVQVVSVFFSALLGMVVGIFLELFKDHRTEVKATQERQKQEVAQINVAIAGIGYNIETSLHAVFQNILPHYNQSHSAYKALEALLDTKADGERIAQFAASLHKYPALMMTCPEMHFIEWDFFKELPFIVEKDPELLKQAGWLISRSREMANAIKNRNRYIEMAMSTVISQQGALNFHQLRNTLQLQTSVSDSESVIALQFFELLLDIDKRLEAINDTYKIAAKKSKLMPPEPLQTAMDQLREIFKTVVPNMPT